MRMRISMAAVVLVALFAGATLESSSQTGDLAFSQVPFHDGRVGTINPPSELHMSPAEVVNRPVSTSVTNDGDHTDNISLHIAFVPPGGTSDPGHCTPNGVDLWDFGTGLNPGQMKKVNQPVDWQCLDPAAVDGMNWLLIAFVDHGMNDLSSCTTVQQVTDGTCSVAINDDDDDDFDNFRTRALPRVVAEP